MSWTQVVTDPLGIAGFALALVFGVAGRLMAQKSEKYPQWIVPVAFGLATACVVGGLVLAYKHGSVSSAITAVPTPTMRIDKIDQNANNGVAVAGVQGDVTVNKPAIRKDPKPQIKS